MLRGLFHKLLMSGHLAVDFATLTLTPLVQVYLIPTGYLLPLSARGLPLSLALLLVLLPSLARLIPIPKGDQCSALQPVAGTYKSPMS